MAHMSVAMSTEKLENKKDQQGGKNENCKAHPEVARIMTRSD